MDISAAIAQRVARISALEQEISALREELLALRKAAEILGLVSADAPAAPDVMRAVRRGKPVGAISNRWRAVLADMFPPSSRHSVADIQAIAKRHEIEVETHSVRDRIRKFVDAGYLTRHDDDTASLSSSAVEKFALQAKNQSASPVSEEADDS